MVLVPMLFGELWDDCMDGPLRSSQIIGKHLDREPFPGGFLVTFDGRPKACNRKSCCQNSKNCKKDAENQKSSEIPTIDFQISLDVQEFKPEEISMKATNQCIIVEAKHEEKDAENGYVLKHFVRRYQLPDGHDNQKIASTLSSDGVLSISAPRLALPEPEKERLIEVKLAAKSNQNEKQSETSIDTNFTLEDVNE